MDIEPRPSGEEEPDTQADDSAPPLPALLTSDVSDEDVPAIRGTHPLAKLLPEMSWVEYVSTKDDIRRNGIVDPIVVTSDGLLLDGVHRSRIADELGITPPTLVYVGSDPLTFVLSKNVFRRHLTTSQRAMFAAKIRRFANATQEQMARSMGVSKRMVEMAELILSDITRDNASNIIAIERGEMAVSKAHAEIQEGIKAQAEHDRSSIQTLASSLWRDLPYPVGVRERAVGDEVDQQPETFDSTLAAAAGAAEPTTEEPIATPPAQQESAEPELLYGYDDARIVLDRTDPRAWPALRDYLQFAIQRRVQQEQGR
jgi:hypothetical protein